MEEIMILENAEFQATIPATDLARARNFYEEKLGLSPERVMQAGIIYRFGKETSFFLYPSATAGAGHTLGGWIVEDLHAAVQELRDLGIEFEEYDFPGLKTIDGIADLGSELAAWFRDSEGNILAVSHFQ
jgi:extradiol dioxygenase family protein